MKHKGVTRAVKRLAKISENSGWKVNRKVIFWKFHSKILELLLRYAFFNLPLGTNRSKVTRTLPFDLSSRLKSFAEEKWREIRNAGSGNCTGLKIFLIKCKGCSEALSRDN